MDVQAAAATATILPPAPIAPAPPIAKSTPVIAPAAAPAASVPTVSGTDSGSSSSSNSSIGPTPGLATLPAGPPDGSKKNAADDTSVAAGVAQLYNAAAQNVSVSFQIEQNPNEIVTVFTDKQTGKVIVQFPSETMIALAKLFDKLDGGVVDKKV